ncbi:MAG: DUF6273 domain-containing protein [Treponema sp.]|nr:DUF6273 domain-containing protein [Treponema sp.]MCL2245124.1 DUF6273 domain-containing protein [Treponema sp.]
MNNKLLTSAISALDSVGFDVKLFCYSTDVDLDCFGVKHTGKSILDENCKKESDVRSRRISNVRFPGESYDICRITGAVDWREALSHASSLLQEDRANEIHVRDFLYVSFDVPAADYDGVHFNELKVERAKIVVVERKADKIIFNFDDVIFRSAINARDSNEKGFSQSALAKYLNGVFLDAMGIEDYLLLNEDGVTHITLPTAYELFGEAEYWNEENNFTETAYQFEYYKNEKNRVRALENETAWYWTSSARASSSAGFCSVGSGGYSSNYNASSVGGVAPAFCVA